MTPPLHPAPGFQDHLEEILSIVESYPQTLVGKGEPLIEFRGVPRLGFLESGTVKSESRKLKSTTWSAMDYFVPATWIGLEVICSSVNHFRYTACTTARVRFVPENIFRDQLPEAVTRHALYQSQLYQLNHAISLRFRNAPMQAKILVKLSFFQSLLADPDGEITFVQKDLASMLGTSPSRLNREVQELIRGKVITRLDTSTYRINKDRLQKRVQDLTEPLGP